MMRLYPSEDTIYYWNLKTLELLIPMLIEAYERKEID